MNVYDFDNTIYNGDSTIDFYLFCLKKNPSLLRYLPRQVVFFVLFSFKHISKTRFKEEFYVFLSGVRDVDSYINEFWDFHKSKIKPWYMERLSESDVIISASPDFLLSEIGKRLKIKIIASNVNKYNGRYNGENCYGKEKVYRFWEECGDLSQIDNFYTDSKSDYPMACIAKTAFLVKGNSIKKWIIQ